MRRQNTSNISINLSELKDTLDEIKINPVKIRKILSAITKKKTKHAALSNTLCAIAPGIEK